MQTKQPKYKSLSLSFLFLFLAECVFVNDYLIQKRILCWWSRCEDVAANHAEETTNYLHNAKAKT